MIGQAQPWVIAHRGASGYRPEHSAASYALAAAQGADVLEPDLLLSADGELVVRHDLGLARSTDIAQRPEFASRARTNASGETDWWIDDFTWDELSTLHAGQPWPTRIQDFNRQGRLLRFCDLCELAESESRRRGRRFWLYPETKHPAYFQSRGQDFAMRLAQELIRLGLTGPDAPVLVQSFDWRVLPVIKRRCGVRTVALIDAATPFDLRQLNAPTAPIADGIGVAKSLLFEAPGEHSHADSGLVRAAHAQGLFVHAWTFRSDQLPPGFSDPVAEYLAAYRTGVDAVFSDFPDHAVLARERFLQLRHR